MSLRLFLFALLAMSLVACGSDDKDANRPDGQDAMDDDASLADGSTDAEADAVVIEEPCTTPSSPKIFLFSLGGSTIPEFGGSRADIDAYAANGLPEVLPTAEGTTYRAHGFIGFTGDAIKDFPANHCVPSTIPVVGIDEAGVETSLADDWDDFLDGTIPTTISEAIGIQDFSYFWTGSNADGSANGHDCSGWSTTDGSDASISNRSNTTENWLNGFNEADCNSGYTLLGLAYCTDNCP